MVLVVRKMERSIVDIILEKNTNCNEGLKQFIKHFYIYLSDEYNSDEYAQKIDRFFFIARDLYSFVVSRQINDSNVRVFRPNLKENGWYDNSTVVEIVTEDKPFLVDSITEELKHQGCIIYDRINSVVSRNIHGRNVKESVIYFSITCMSDVQMLALQSELINILHVIECCVNDWCNIVQKCDEITHEIKNNLSLAKEDNEEIRAFLEWLKKDNFIFLGYAEYTLAKAGITRDENNLLGITRIDTAVYDLAVSKEECSPIYITRSDRVSKVHRHANMDCIGIRRYDADGLIIGEVRFLGLLTSIVYYQDVRLIPIIRKKIATVEKWANFSPSSHNHKALISVLQDFPRAELLHIPEKELFASCMGILSLSIREEVRLFVHIDKIGRFVRCIIFVPRNQFSTALWLRMQKVLASSFNGRVLHEQIRDSGLVRLQLILKVQSIRGDYNIKSIESKLKGLASSWTEDLQSILKDRCDIKLSDDLYAIYQDVFPISYQDVFTAKEAFYDIRRVEKIRKGSAVESVLYYDKDDKYQLKVYILKETIQLFDMLPVIKNMGMKVTNHYSYVVKLDDACEVLIHHFIISIAIENLLPLEDVKGKFETALQKIWMHEVENDYYNSLVLGVGLDWREVLLLRALGNYLKQIRFNYTEVFIQQAMFKHTEVVKLLVRLFHTRFDPELFSDIDNRKSAVETICNKLEELLGKIDSLAEDKIIRALIEVNMSILRTNYYYDKQYISFKINSQSIQNLPLPKPFVEIYVYSHSFEAIHLRGGMVARGGLRWSDRTEDFRTEVLGLMKAQMTKNTVIVPVGSKGGFVVKLLNKDSSNVVQCYKDFLRAMLDITDNIEDGLVKNPSNMIIYDEDDTYLVVAADKGTASFSDYANEVAKEYNFWLGDAFASGGSSGYDHKSMSITSRGAWISAQNHLWVVGHDNAHDLTMVGIGDMSGDVFGNGLIFSNKLKLLMAFNHMHIFVDPNPNPILAFAERKRLFYLKKSTWMDYNKEIISTGGGVFNRRSKFIRLSQQMKDLFGVTVDKLDPYSLILKGLKLEVDIIWNGGVGTFIKSLHESNDVVDDKNNDLIRINGSELKARMLIEGGNLGCTQFGRIEYAKSGGYINTDFIDNSAGVTCSDMEVNIKIALSKAVLRGKITIAQRNQLMQEMQEEVTSIILNNTNVLQVRSLIIAKSKVVDRLEQYHRLIKSLEKEERLNRSVEFIPSDEEFVRMYSERKGLSIPEIAVVMAYAKMSLYDQILFSEVPDDEYLDRYLIDYFPHGMRQGFSDEIMEHRLKREIITTQLVNAIINRMGCTFIPSVMEQTGVLLPEIVKIYISVYHAYDLESVWCQIDKLKETVTVSIYLKTVEVINKFVEYVVHWFIRNHNKPINMRLTIAQFKDRILVISKNISKTLDEELYKAYNKKLKQYEEYGLSEDLSVVIANLQFTSSALPIIKITNNLKLSYTTDVPLLLIASVYFKIGCYLQLNWLKDATIRSKHGDYWQRLSIVVMFDDLQDRQMNLAEQVLRVGHSINNYPEAFEKWCKIHSDSLERYHSMLNDLKTLKELNLSRLIIIMKYLAQIG